MSLFDLNRRFIASGLSRRAIPNHRDFSGGIGSGGGGSSGLLDFSALTVVRTAGGDWTDPRDSVVYPDPGSNLPRLASDGALYVDSGRHTLCRRDLQRTNAHWSFCITIYTRVGHWRSSWPGHYVIVAFGRRYVRPGVGWLVRKTSIPGCRSCTRGPAYWS
jgi:hypothetical protein